MKQRLRCGSGHFCNLKVVRDPSLLQLRQAFLHPLGLTHLSPLHCFITFDSIDQSLVLHHGHLSRRLLLFHFPPEYRLAGSLLRYDTALEKPVKHEVVVHRLRHHLRHLPVLELHKCKTTGATSLLGPAQSKVGDGAKLAEKGAHRLLIESVGYVGDVDHSPIFKILRFPHSLLLLFEVASWRGNCQEGCRLAGLQFFCLLSLI